MLVSPKITKRIDFYSLEVFQKDDHPEKLDPQPYVRDILAYIMQLTRASRKRQLGDDRFYFLSDCDDVGGCSDTQTIVFKFARYGTKPPLIDESTLSERPNTKQLTEGDRHRTHAVIRYFDDEAIVLLEGTRPAITMKRFVDYLNFFAGELHHKHETKLDYIIGFSIIPKGNFLAELRKLNQVNAGTLTMSKRLMGSEGLDLSNNLSKIQREICLEVKAKRNESMLRVAEEIFEKMITPRPKVERLRIKGKNHQGHFVKLDTKAIKKERFLDFTPNPLTGEITTEEMLNRLVLISKEF